MTRIIGMGQGGMQPSTPTIGTATAGAGEASVTFTPSTYIGKSTIVYRAISNPGSFSSTSTTSPITVTGLTNGTAYTFTVQGETPYGVNSLSSAASNSVTPAVQGSYDSIASFTLASTASTISFSSIPNTYRHLEIRYSAAHTGSGGTDLWVRMNNDTGNNYNYMWTWATGFAGPYDNHPFGNNYISVGYIIGTATESNQLTTGYISFTDYAVSDKTRTLEGQNGIMRGSTSDNTALVALHGNWNNSTVVNQISLLTSGNAFAVGSKFALYGLKDS